MGNMKLKGRFALFCDYALTSSDGKLSIIGEFDQLNSTKEKPILNKGFVVGSFEGEPEKTAGIQTRFVDEFEKDILPPRVLNIRFGHGGKANVVIEIAGLAFEKGGSYKVIFQGYGKVLAEAQLKVVKFNKNVREGNSEAVN